MLTGLRELTLAEIKAPRFAVMAMLVGCYRGPDRHGWPQRRRQRPQRRTSLGESTHDGALANVIMR